VPRHSRRMRASLRAHATPRHARVGARGLRACSHNQGACGGSGAAAGECDARRVAAVAHARAK
jgi:hypothetical protein